MEWAWYPQIVLLTVSPSQCTGNNKIAFEVEQRGAENLFKFGLYQQCKPLVSDHHMRATLSVKLEDGRKEVESTQVEWTTRGIFRLQQIVWDDVAPVTLRNSWSRSWIEIISLWTDSQESTTCRRAVQIHRWILRNPNWSVISIWILHNLSAIQKFWGSESKLLYGVPNYSKMSFAKS